MPCKSLVKGVVSSSLILRKLLRETEFSGPFLGFRLPPVVATNLRVSSLSANKASVPSRPYTHIEIFVQKEQ